MQCSNLRLAKYVENPSVAAPVAVFKNRMVVMYDCKHRILTSPGLVATIHA